MADPQTLIRINNNITFQTLIPEVFGYRVNWRFVPFFLLALMPFLVLPVGNEVSLVRQMIGPDGKNTLTQYGPLKN